MSESSTPSSTPVTAKQPTWSSWKAEAPSSAFSTLNFSNPGPSAKRNGRSYSRSETPAQSAKPAPAISEPIASTSLQNEISPETQKRTLTQEEEEIRDRTANAISLNLATDHILALYPDADTPFEDMSDVVNRLLPYHVFQYPKEDFARPGRKSKGKEKASELDVLRKEIEDTKFALDCHTRFRSLQSRFRKVRTRSGKFSTPHGQAISLGQVVLEADRAVTTVMEQEYASTKQELEKVQRANRIAQASANKAAQAQPQTPFYTYAPAAGARQGAAATYAQYYGTYSYPYGYITPTGTAAPQLSAMTSKFPTAPSAPGTSQAPSTSSVSTQNPPQTPLQPTPAPAIASTSSTSSTSSQPASTQQTQTKPSASSVPVPVSIPVASLPALQALGILPVPKAVLPPSNQPQPAAVLLGTTSNGTMLSLEINVALLQPAQMSGLAILLSGLMQISGSLSGSASNGANKGQTQLSTATTASGRRDGVPQGAATVAPAPIVQAAPTTMSQGGNEQSKNPPLPSLQASAEQAKEGTPQRTNQGS